MKKQSKLRIVCTQCESPAVPDTWPPLCAKCARLVKKAARKEKRCRTLKELTS